MHEIMRKILTQQFMGVIAGLATVILSLTLYAYKGDQDAIKDGIKFEETQRIKQDLEIKAELLEKITSHEEKDAIRFKNYEKDIKETNEMVKYLYQRELNKSSR